MMTFDELMPPLLEALRQLGGSGSIDEIYEQVVSIVNFSDEDLNTMHNPERSNQTKIGYRLAWARTYLKKAGFLENSTRGVWALTDKGKQAHDIDTRQIVNSVRAQVQQNQTETITTGDEPANGDATPEEAMQWREQLHHLLISEMSPDAFERLTQRMLRESGFVHVEVTGRTGDGGIDGKGIARLNGIMSFHVVFQCKKYKGSVGAPEIRNFRGATVGRADRGLFITTGSFTKAAVEEANRDGASPIDLVDGDQLADKLKELQLGVKTEMVEKVSIDTDWLLKV